MNYFAFSALINLIASLTLFVIMMSKTNRSRFDTWFAGFCLSTMVWSSGYFFWQISTNHDSALFWTKFLMGGAIIVGLTYLQFVISFLNAAQAHKYFLRIANTVYASLFILNFWPYIVANVEPRSTFLFWPVPGPFFHVFLAIWVFCVCYSTFLLYRAYIRASGLFKTQIRLLFFGMAIAFISGSTNYFLWYNINIRPVMNIFVTIYPILIFYAIARYKFFNIKVIATEIFALLLIGASIWQFMFGQSNNSYLIVGIVSLTTIAGIMLIRSVRREVEQRQTLQDLTMQLSQANTKLTALDKARAEFISIASHQLRTPPATLKWYLSAIIAGDYGKIPASVSGPLKKAEQTNNLLISLIEDMLNVSRIERGTMEFLFEPVDISVLAQTTYEQLAPIASDKQLKFVYTPPQKPLPKIMADKEKLRQVINNLIDNAIKYTPKGSITLSLKQEKGKVLFSITDTGKGIAKGETKNIFEKYTRGKDSIMHSAGLGLGLYVAKIIVEQHKGKLWAESAGEGKGSTFIVSIPIKNDLKATSQINLAK